MMRNFLVSLLVILASSTHATLIGSIGQGATVNEFSGNQGQDGWNYGFWNFTQDADGVYTAIPGGQDDLTLFAGGDGQGAWNGTTQQWSGSAWDANTDTAPPWTFVGGSNVHPQDGQFTTTPTDDEQAPVIRYVVEAGNTGQLNITGFFNNASAGGDGTTGRIFRNGVELFSAVSDGTTVNLNTMVGVVPGDFIDFMVDIGPGAFNSAAPQNTDGADGTNYRFELDLVVIPEPSSLLLGLAGLLTLGVVRRFR